MAADVIDVVVCTWNSAAHLAECLAAIRANVPVATLWVIDRFSTDATVSICRTFAGRVVQRDCNLGLARKIGIDKVETPIFAFIDSDYVVCDGWFDQVRAYWDDRSGMVSGRHTIVCPVKEYERYRNTSRRRDGVAVERRGRGGGTENTLVRTALVKDLEMPSDVAGREDWIIAEHVKSRGYDVAHVPVYSKHYAGDPYKQALWAGGAARRLNRLKLGYRFPTSIASGSLVLDAGRWMIHHRDPAVALMLVRLSARYLLGFVTNDGFDRS